MSNSNKKTSEEVEEEEEEDDELTCFYWLDAGVFDAKTKRRYHKSIHLSVPRNKINKEKLEFDMHIGDTVELLSDIALDTNETRWFCHIVRLWDSNNSNNNNNNSGKSRSETTLRPENDIFFEGRWFLPALGVEKLPKLSWRGPLSRSGTVAFMSATPNNVMLMTHVDVNPVSTILRPVKIIFCKPESQITTNECWKNHDAWLCNYQVHRAGVQGPFYMTIVPDNAINVDKYKDLIKKMDQEYEEYCNNDGEEEEAEVVADEQPPPQPQSKPKALPEASTTRSSANNATAATASSSNSNSSATAKASKPVKERLPKPVASNGGSVKPPAPRRTRSVAAANPILGVEGSSVLREEISVGKNYQAEVPKFDPTPSFRETGSPVCVWKPGCLDDSELERYWRGLAIIHNRYLTENNLTSYEPTLPLSMPVLREFRETKNTDTITASAFRTAAHLTKQPNNLRIELDIDGALAHLAENKWKVDKALVTAPLKFSTSLTTAWSDADRIKYDQLFVEHRGEWRSMNGLKPLTSIVDYHFRFHVPQQFRRFYERKHEQAVKMLQGLEQSCIDEDWYPAVSSDIINANSSNLTTANSNMVVQDYPTKRPRLSVQDALVDGAVETRKRVAYSLLYKVYDRMGPSVLTTVAQLVKSLQQEYKKADEEALLDILSSEKDLQQDLMLFLPKL